MSNQPGPNDPQDPNPWPVYGQGNQNPPQSPDSPWPTYPAPTQPQSGATNTPPPAYGAPQPPPSPYGAPQQNYGATPYMSNPYGQAPQQGRPPMMSLPSRTGPVLTIIGGVVLMVIVAPIVLFALILNSVGISSIVDNSLQAANGEAVMVDETGAIGVIVTTSTDAVVGCSVTDESGNVFVMSPELDGGILAARGLTPGPYTVSCEGLSPSSSLIILDGRTLEQVVPSSMRAFGWSSAIGIAGLGTLIAGIVWLVRRNQARGRILSGWRP